MSYQTRDLTNSVVAITGASAGIGAAAARQLVEAGARVVLGARRSERLEQVVESLGSHRATAVSMDVRNPDDSRRLVEVARERWGRLDSVVANAGIGMYGSVRDYSDDEIQQMVDTNITGTIWTVRAAVPVMMASGSGDIVIVASVAGLRGAADEAAYAATKFAQIGLAGALDRELRSQGIRVTALAPAGVSTEFALGVGRTEGDPALDDLMSDEDVAFAVTTVLKQPRSVRTSLWALWSMGQQS